MRYTTRGGIGGEGGTRTVTELNVIEDDLNSFMFLAFEQIAARDVTMKRIGQSGRTESPALRHRTRELPVTICRIRIKRKRVRFTTLAVLHNDFLRNLQLFIKSSQLFVYCVNVKELFVYCVNVKEKTDYIIIIAVTDASLIYRESEADWPCLHLGNSRWAGRVLVKNGHFYMVIMEFFNDFARAGQVGWKAIGKLPEPVRPCREGT